MKEVIQIHINTKDMAVVIYAYGMGNLPIFGKVRVSINYVDKQGGEREEDRADMYYGLVLEKIKFFALSRNR